MEKSLKIFLVLLLIIISMYFAIAGWLGGGALESVRQQSQVNSEPVVYDGITFASAQAAEEFRKEKTVHEWFPWMWNQPLPPLFIATVGFGLLGGAIGLTKRLTTGILPRLPSIVFIWLFAGAMGIVLFFLFTWIFDQKQTRNTVFILLTLLGGLFSEETYALIRTKLAGIFDVLFTGKK